MKAYLNKFSIIIVIILSTIMVLTTITIQPTQIEPNSNYIFVDDVELGCQVIVEITGDVYDILIEQNLDPINCDVFVSYKKNFFSSVNVQSVGATWKYSDDCLAGLSQTSADNGPQGGWVRAFAEGCGELPIPGT